MGKIKIKFISENQDAFKHSDFSKGAIAQGLQIKYGVSQIEKIEIPGDDFELSIDIDKYNHAINWAEIDFPSLELREKISEIIYYTDIKSKIDKIFEEIKYMDWNKRFEIIRISEPLIVIIANLKDSKYFNSIQLIHNNKVADDLKYSIIQKEGRHLCNMKSSASQREKRNAVDEFTTRLNKDLNYVNFALKNIV